MPLNGDFFDRIRTKAVFLDEVHADFYTHAEGYGCHPHWNPARALDAYFQWMQDLERLERVEGKVRRADHLKCAAHLIFWLRRSSPVNDFAVERILPSHDFMMKYGREYLAFDLGYRAAQLYETKIYGRTLSSDAFSLQSQLTGVKPNDFIETTCHVMKLKEISPHSILLVLKAIFLRP